MLEAVAVGRLTADPRIQRHTKDGKDYKVCEFRLACQQRKNSTDFIKVTAWGGTGEFLFKTLQKGEKLFVQGSLHVPQFDKEKGRTYGPYIVVDKFEFCSSKKDLNNQAEQTTGTDEPPETLDESEFMEQQ